VPIFKPITLLVLAAPLGAQSEFVAERMPTPSCHASTIVEVRPGEFLAAWFGGRAEGSADVAIWGARRKNGRWEEPAVLVREPQIATWNPVLFHSADGVLWLYYKFGPSPQQWSAGRLFSRDGGASWSTPEHLPAGIYGPIRAKPLLLPDGAIVSGTSVESYQSWAAWIERSTNNGQTWSRIGPITLPSSGIIQPVVVPMGGSHLRIYARSQMGKICVSDSLDAGVTWTAAHAIDLPNPNAGIDVVRLRDGRLVLIYNHSATARSPLNLAVSRDGDHWTSFQALETEPGEYSYPAMIQGSDGQLHITYTWRRERIRYVEWPLDRIPSSEGGEPAR
jgi:predicted neuraminidase